MQDFSLKNRVTEYHRSSIPTGNPRMRLKGDKPYLECRYGIVALVHYLAHSVLAAFSYFCGATKG